MSTRRRSSPRCSVRVMASGAGLSVRRLSERAMPTRPPAGGRAGPPRRSIHRRVVGHRPAVAPHGVDGALRVADRHPGDRRLLVGLHHAGRPVGPARGQRRRPPPGPVVGASASVPARVASLSAAWVSASESRKLIGERTAWVILSVDGRSGKLPRTSVSSRSRRRRKSPHSEPDLAGHLGQLVRAEHHDGDHAGRPGAWPGSGRARPECTGARVRNACAPRPAGVGPGRSRRPWPG